MATRPEPRPVTLGELLAPNTFTGALAVFVLGSLIVRAVWAPK